MTLTIVSLPIRKFRTATKRSKWPPRAKKPRKVKRSTLVNKLDAVFSLYIRTSFADKQGALKCYTCPKVGTIKTMQNGHYVSRSVRFLRWDIRNCRPQCYGCNIMHGGQPITFRENLVKEGEDVLFLESLRHTIFKPNDEWFVLQIVLYQTKLESI